MVKNQKIRIILSLALNIIIIICELVSLLDIFGIVSISSENVFGGFKIQAFRYFTVLSNLVLLISSIVILVCDIKNLKCKTYIYNKYAMFFKFCSTILVSLTFITSALFLAPIAEITGLGYFSMFSGYIFFLHFLCPVLAIISIIFFEPLNDISFKANFINLIPVIAYGIVYFIQIAFGNWPDFYSFTFGGKYYFIPIVTIIMLSITFGISVCEYKLSKKIQK